MNPRLQTILSLGLLVPLAAAVAAQSSRECKERTIVVTALDAQSAPVTNLIARDFRITYRGTAAKVAPSEFWRNPGGRVVVVLDMSGSMRGGQSDKWKIAHAMATAFVTWAPPKEQISLLSFADTVQQRFSFSDGRKPIEDWLASAPVREGNEHHGGTALLDTVLAAVRELTPTLPGDAIYVISDGGDNFSKAAPSQVERSLLDLGIRVFAFMLRGRRSSMEEVLGPMGLDELVRRSGGVEANLDAFHLPYDTRENYGLNPKVADSMQSSTLTIQTQIANFYLLRIEGVDPSSKPKDWNVEVVDSQGRKRKDIALAYPHSPASCPQQTVH